MTVSCTDLMPFVDGELSEPERSQFANHLRVCQSCSDELVVQVNLQARLSTTPRTVRTLQLDELTDCVRRARIGADKPGMLDRYVIATAQLADTVHRYFELLDAVWSNQSHHGPALASVEDRLRHAVGAPMRLSSDTDGLPRAELAGGATVARVSWWRRARRWLSW